MISFYLNGRMQHVDAEPHLSVLDLLRERLNQTGTKEGCASGDCGACTVAIGEVDADGRLHYHSANACIMPAHQLSGRHLVTVEGISHGDELHPCQAAMVEHHGSQCGFCTPGIVMSLFTLHEHQRQQPAPLTPQRLEAALGGNLCRCTGYRPIRDAALAMHDTPGFRPAWLDDLSLADALATDVGGPGASPSERNVASSGAETSGAETTNASGFYQPHSLADLVALRQRFPEARLVAGGTDLWLEVTQQLKDLPQVIDVTRVTELLTVESAADDLGRSGVWIGAAVTYSRLEPLFAEHYPAFAHLLHRLGSGQVRNRGTLGGNVANASPIGDTPPVLLALDARLRLTGPGGSRTLAASEFFLGYRDTALGDDEVLEAIFLPHLANDQQLKVWKLSKRREDDISAVLGAFSWRVVGGRLADVRLAFGGMAAIPARATGAEAALEGKPADSASLGAVSEALAQDFTPMSDVRGSSEYRQDAAAALLERLLLVIASSAQGAAQNATSPGASSADARDHSDTLATEVMLHAYAH
ncbi:xanthine dehydrogenase small subunit [Halomonas denitrificans]|uniref:xanthine dehydrogenase small subunit n=1 Tax=Halomonas denitrificans TaxID=370769 RepID=UPI001CD2478A|nr:xanthine dehydrogenase small subunit [Halomonas denitrificans]MCA0973801.1 xanthine dehydrogenase small subunit [Halomonas denitrificans]